MTEFMPEERSAACPACDCLGGAEFEKFAEFTLYRCPVCDLVYSFPMRAMTPGEYGKMYEGEGFHDEFATALGNGHAKFLKRNKPLPGSEELLDVGTSTGLFVHAAATKGFRALGIDTDARAIDVGKRIFPNINLENCSLEQVFSRGKKYNYVTLFEVLEHVSEPRKLIEEAKNMLHPGGKLTVFVPNRNRTPKLYKEMIVRGIDLPPHHLSKWSKKSLVNLYKVSGFKIVYVGDIGKYRFPLLPGLGIASGIRSKIADACDKTLSSTVTIDKLKQGDVLRRFYGILAKCRAVIDGVIFFPLDAIYRLRGYEKDGLYIEGEKW